MSSQLTGNHGLGIFLRFDLGPLLQGQTRIAKLKVLITRLLLVLEVCNVKPTHRKSWARNLLMWSDLTFDPSFKVKQGHPNLKVLITCLLLVLQVCNVKLIYRKSWAGNLLIWSDLTLVLDWNLLMSDLTFGPSFKVKGWFTGFGELSFQWIQICIGSPMRRSSFFVLNIISL